MKRHYNCKFAISKEKEIVNHYINGLSTGKLGEKYNVNHVTILNLLKHYKINRRTISKTLINTSRARKYFFNENYFNIINTDNKAYLLGLIYSDGFISNKDYRLGFTSTDKELVEFFLKELDANHKIYINKKRKITHKTQYTISMNSKILWNDLINLGCTQNKTHTIKFPYIDEKFHSNFIRGLWDGDGSFLRYPEKRIIKKDKIYLRSNLVGNYNIITKVEKILRDKLNLNKRKICSHGNIYRITYSSNMAISVRDYLYNNAKLFLQRKYDVAYA